MDGTDSTAFDAAYPSTSTDPEYDRDFDADFDGDVDAYDQDAFNAQFNQAGADKTVTVAGRAWSPTGNPYLYTGRRLDAETGIYFYRARNYHPGHKQFIQRDPLGYINGPSVYEYVGSNPLSRVDPLGTDFWDGVDRGLAFCRGIGDTLSGGLTDRLRGVIWGEAGEEYWDGWHTAGEWAGTAGEVVAGVGIGKKVIGRAAKEVIEEVGERGAKEVGEEVGERVGAKVAGKVDDVADAGKKPPGDNDAARRGREAHDAFKEKVQAKPGWQSEPRLIDPKTGKTVIPDAVDPKGRPIELKPNTPSGRRSGKTQLPKYERATGQKGRIVTYDP